MNRPSLEDDDWLDLSLCDRILLFFFFFLARFLVYIFI